MKLIVGLGNPGRRYARSRHNIGFMCLEAFASKHKRRFVFDKKFNGEWLKFGDTVLLKPHTFMNLSGNSVNALMKYFNIPVDQILVIYDDLDLPTGKLRLRAQGTSGGHKGIQSIIENLNTDAIQRVRFGIDKPINMDAKDYVLKRFSKLEGDDVITSIQTTNQIIKSFIEGMNFIDIMNTYN